MTESQRGQQVTVNTNSATFFSISFTSDMCLLMKFHCVISWEFPIFREVIVFERLCHILTNSINKYIVYLLSDGNISREMKRKLRQ